MSLLNHAVLVVCVVGYAWKVKNSWGASWGKMAILDFLGEILVVFVLMVDIMLHDFGNLYIHFKN